MEMEMLHYLKQTNKQTNEERKKKTNKQTNEERKMKTKMTKNC